MVFYPIQACLCSLYSDLYYLVKFLPQYALPRAIGTEREFCAASQETDMAEIENSCSPVAEEPLLSDADRTVKYEDPTPVASVRSTKRMKSVDSGRTLNENTGSNPNPFRINAQDNKPPALPLPATARKPTKRSSLASVLSFKVPVLQKTKKWTVLRREDEHLLHPARNPPKYGLFDIFPFSMFVGLLVNRGKHVSGKKGAALLRDQLHSQTTSHNLPLELSLYLVCAELFSLLHM